MRSLLATLSVLIIGLSVPAQANTPAESVEAVAQYASTSGVSLKMHSDESERMIGRMLNEDGFWSDASVSHYKSQLYDTLKLKKVSDGYMPMITGEGDTDLPHDVVKDIIFDQMGKLPKYMSGAVAVVPLGSGTDPLSGETYSDSFFVLDLTLFYVKYPQRMYKKTQGDSTYLWFEKLEPSYVPTSTWGQYEAVMDKTMAGLDLRSFMFGSVLDVGDIYGIFIVSPGESRTSRVTFVSKLSFDDSAGWLAKAGSKMPPVLKAGLKSGFDASVRIAKDEAARR